MKNRHEPAEDSVPAPQTRTPQAPGIGRSDFWILSFILNAIFFGLAATAENTAPEGRGTGDILVFVFLFVLFIGLQTFLCAARLRNTGTHPGWAFLSFVPLFSIVLLPRLLFFRPKYVEKPRFGAFGWSVAALCALLFLVGAVWLFKTAESFNGASTQISALTPELEPIDETIAGLRIRKGSLKWERVKNTGSLAPDVVWRETWKAEDEDSGIIYQITKTEHDGKAEGYFYRRETLGQGDLFFDKASIAGIPSEGIYMESVFGGTAVHCLQFLFAVDDTGWEISIMAPGKEEALHAFNSITRRIISVAE